MKEYIKTLIIAMVMFSGFELMLPSGKIKQTALSVMGIIIVVVILSPLFNLFNTMPKWIDDLEQFSIDNSFSEGINYE